MQPIASRFIATVPAISQVFCFLSNLFDFDLFRKVMTRSHSFGALARPQEAMCVYCLPALFLPFPNFTNNSAPDFCEQQGEF